MIAAMNAERYHVFETAMGHCALAWSDNGVTRTRLPDPDFETAERGLLRRVPDAVRGKPDATMADLVTRMTRYFSGEREDFSTVTLDLGPQDELFTRIYAAAQRIGWGCTTTYGTLAKTLGDDWQIAREVGQAMAKNKVPLIIPCHRVLAAGGKLGGFSAPGGANTKARMLALESVAVGAGASRQGMLEL